MLSILKPPLAAISPDHTTWFRRSAITSYTASGLAEVVTVGCVRKPNGLSAAIRGRYPRHATAGNPCVRATFGPLRGSILGMDEPLRLVAESAGEEALTVAEPLSFEVFFEAEARTLFHRLCAITGNAAEAEEIMQDAFLALWERWDRVGSIQDPTAYLYRTAMNAFRKRSRRAALAIRRTLALAPDPAPFSEIDEQQDVVAALAELSPRQRAALVLTDVLDYSSEEAGKALGVSAGTVRGLASRARENLRRQVGERT